MNKRAIDGQLKRLASIEEKLPVIKRFIEFNKTMNLSDCRDELEREQTRESLAEADSEIINLLLDINLLTEEMVKQIDMESWKEYRDSK